MEWTTVSVGSSSRVGSRKNDGSGENAAHVPQPTDWAAAFEIARVLDQSGLPPEQSIKAVGSDGRAAVEENLGDPAPRGPTGAL